MTMFIRIASVCDALEEFLPVLPVDTRDVVRALLAATTQEARGLCFLPIREGCLTELWAHYIFAAEGHESSTAAGVGQDLREVEPAPPTGWVVFPGPDANAEQVRRLAQIVEGFHFFAPLTEVTELLEAAAPLARALAALRSIRPIATAELHGEALALFPPATFRAAAPGLIRIDDPMPPRPQGVPRYRANTALLPNSWFVVLHAPGTKVEVDAIFGLVGHP
ncbi:Uncharacterised protein [Xylophilus ampelinus]|uniref:Uncharacterized protein n=1 Tax=Variovorax paradoxus TaxID=34073 RepID=A0A2W5QTZ2_VARPD|nr:MAG: hypothetical protein DI563_00085 [Variovorax paradoxus]VTY30017.1 Uncharacterised protein [Xylophilus ampelinus]